MRPQIDIDTNIIAIASPPGRSVRGIIRLSGPTVFAWLQPHLAIDDGAFPTRGMFDGTLTTILAAPLRCRVLVMPAPRSYTGQDSVEIFVPGQPDLLARIVDGLIGSGHGGRRAEPGEFTARAFMTGRITLSEAEGVAATIEARSDAELRAARMLTDGAIGKLATGLADDIAHLLALVEAGIDFTDQDDVIPIAPADLDHALLDVARRLDDHLARATGLESISALPWVVLTGPPNAGKSMLFNALLGGDRAVVTATRGTTRDVLAEPLEIETTHGPAEVMLVDAAGDEVAVDTLTQRMQAAAHDARARADLSIVCVPPDARTPPPCPHAFVVHTKADIDPAASSRPLAVSAVTGAGLPELRRAIAQRLADRAVSLAAETFAFAPRHETALRAAHEALAEARSHVDPALRSLESAELVAGSLRDALNQVGSIAGAVTPDDVLGRIFATFCVGK